MSKVVADAGPKKGAVVTLGEESLQISDPVSPQFARSASSPARGDERISYDAITSVRADRRQSGMTIYHWDGRATQLRSIEFPDALARDRVLRGLQSRLDPSFRMQEVRYGAARAAALPLLAAAGIAFFTWLNVGALAQLDQGQASVLRLNRIAEKLIFLGALKVLGPVGVMLLGATGVGLALHWLRSRIRRPPIMVKLSRRD